MLLTFAAAACADGSSSATGADPSVTDTSTAVTSDSCRTYATSIAAIQQQSTASVNFSYRYAYNRAVNQLTVVLMGPAATSTTVYQYDSVAAFIDETSVIPNRARARSGTSTFINASGTTTSVIAYEYDGQNRLTRYTSSTTVTSAGNSTTTAVTLTYSAWDYAGRPTAVTVESTTNGVISVQHQTIVYDSRTRTSTTTVTGAVSEVITATFDANGNPLRNVYAYSGSGAPPPTTVNYAALATERICR